MDFKITFFNVLMVLVYAIPGFILIKVKKCKPEHLSSISTILVYVLSPCMVLYSFQGVTVSKELSLNILYFALITLLCQCLLVAVLFGIFKLKKKLSKPKYDENGNEIVREEHKLDMVAPALGNVGFFGLPIINALLPEYSEAKIYSVIFVITMNFIAFTLGAYACTGDKKYCSIKNAIINPTTITAVFAIILYAFDIKFKNLFWSFGPILDDGITLLGKMTTPICMLVLGMRLATADLKEIFLSYKVYIASIVKLVIFPLVSYALVYFIPGLNYGLKAAVLILSATPVAAITLNIAEMLHSEQKYAADLVLISTLLSIITMPLVLLVL